MKKQPNPQIQWGVQPYQPPRQRARRIVQQHQQPSPAQPAKPATKRGGVDGLTVFLLLAVAAIWIWGAIA